MPRVRVTISIDEELLNNVDKLVESTYMIRDRSHFFEIVAYKYKGELEKGA